MSYPSQPSYTPPYGQPPTPPSQNNHLWLIGGTTVVVLAIIMTVTLVLIQRGSDSTDSGSGGDPTTTAATESTEEAEPTGEAEPTDDGGGSEPAGFTEATCGAFDLAMFEELYGEAPDPNETSTSATSSGGSGSLTCTYYTSEFDSVDVSVSSWGDAASAMGWWEDDKAYWTETPGYTITDFTSFGDAGYHMIYGEDALYQKRAINVVIGALQIKVEAWIYPDEQDTALADEFLSEIGGQAAGMFADYT